MSLGGAHFRAIGGQTFSPTFLGQGELMNRSLTPLLLHLTYFYLFLNLKIKVPHGGLLQAQTHLIKN